MDKFLKFMKYKTWTGRIDREEIVSDIVIVIIFTSAISFIIYYV